MSLIYVERLADGTYIGQLLVLENALFPSVGGVVARQVMLVNAVQDAKALAPMLVTLDGIVSDDRACALVNAFSGMLV